MHYVRANATLSILLGGDHRTIAVFIGCKNYTFLRTKSNEPTAFINICSYRGLCVYNIKGPQSCGLVHSQLGLTSHF